MRKDLWVLEMVAKIEQLRRDFKRTHPELYEYISQVQQAKAWDSAGDTVSGASTGYEAANRCWARQRRCLQEVLRLREESELEHGDIDDATEV